MACGMGVSFFVFFFPFGVPLKPFKKGYPAKRHAYVSQLKLGVLLVLLSEMTVFACEAV